MKIMEEVSTILGIYVTDKTIDREVRILEKSGSLSQRKMQEIVIMLCKYLSLKEGK